jgi:hypothetical protein
MKKPIVTFYNTANAPKNELLNNRRQYQMNDSDIFGTRILGTVKTDIDVLIYCVFSYYRFMCVFMQQQFVN